MSTTAPPRPTLQDWFGGLSRDDQIRFLLAVSRELTIVARGYYVPQSDDLTEPGAVREVNEIQHRVAAHAAAFLDDAAAAAHPVAYGSLADGMDRWGLRGQIASAVMRAREWISRQGQ